MKGILKTAFPVIAFSCAIGIALGNKLADRNVNAPQTGHKSIGLKCIPTEVACTDIPNGVVCRDASEKALYLHIGAISCANQLWKPLP